ncbi:MAG: hypothetical protein ACKOPG_10255 [Novosphingobium sp.]
MTSDIFLIATTLTATAIIALASLVGWHGWLRLKTRELEMNRPDLDGGIGSSGARIEMADLKERIRKLEAIAAGVDL